MSDPPREPTDEGSEQSRLPGTGRRRFLAAVGGVGATLLAGCAAAPGDGTEKAKFRLLISDRPGSIDDFDSLTVTFDRGRLFHAETEEQGNASTSTDDGYGGTETDSGIGTETTSGTDNETTSGTDNETTSGTPDTTETDTTTGNETGTSTNGTAATDGADTTAESTEGEQKGWTTIELSGESVDLTEVEGKEAKQVFEGKLPAGRYTKFELYVAEAEGVVEGEEVDVKVPSGKLQITESFEVDETGTTSFVFDIKVVEKGSGGYNLRPVVSESGVAGEDVTVTEVQTTAGGNETTGNETGTGEETGTTNGTGTTTNSTAG